jgi:hypothetical protein
MKAEILLSLLLTSGICAVAQQAPENPKPKPSPDKQAAPRSGKVTPKTADPFLRGGAAPPPGQPPSKPYNVYGLVEYIEVPSDAWLAYSSANPVGLDATAVRAEVQSWIAAGKAKPIELTCVPTRSGQRMVVESIIQHRFPDDYLMTPTTPVPKKFETRNTYFQFEWEPIVSRDLQTLYSAFVPQISRLAGSAFYTPLQRKFAKPGDLNQPLFTFQKTTNSVNSQASQPVLLDAATPFDDNGKLREEVRWLLFFRGAPVPLTLPEKGFPVPAIKIIDGDSEVELTQKQVDDLLNDRSEDPGVARRREIVRAQVESGGRTQLMFEIERLEVSLADLNDWFADKDLEAGTNGLRKSALEWIRAGRGREFDRWLGPVQSGQRTAWESKYEIRYPGGYSIDPIIAPISFETRGAGYTIEMEPALGSDGKTINLSIIPSDVRYCGNMVLHRSEVDGQMVPDVEQPVFATMQITTSLVTALGQYSLLAITTPAGDNMQPDPKRRILTFVVFRQ